MNCFQKMAPRKESVLQKTYRCIKHWGDVCKSSSTGYLDLTVSSNWIELYKSKKYNVTESAKMARDLMKHLKEEDVYGSLFYCLFENGWTMELLEKFFLTYTSKDPNIARKIFKDLSDYSLTLSNTDMKTLKKNGSGIGVYVVDMFLEHFVEDFEGIHVSIFYS